MDQQSRFPLSMRLFHWGMVALLISLLAAGLTMVATLDPWQLTLLTVHKAFGILALVLVIARLMNRLTKRVPPLPVTLSTPQKWIAKASHWLLYSLMFIMPLSGFLMQFYAGRPIDVFGWFRLPAALNVDIELFALFRELHGWSALTLIAVITLHVAAALHHHFIRKDDVLKSML